MIAAEIDAPDAPTATQPSPPERDEGLSVAPVAGDELVVMGFANLASYKFMLRMAKMFASSTHVPAKYQLRTLKKSGEAAEWVENPAAIPNTMIALDMATRMNYSPLAVMQNLNIIDGQPSWSSTFIIAAINGCGRFTPLEWDVEWLGEVDVDYYEFEWEEGPSGKSVKNEKKKTIRIQEARCIAFVYELGTDKRLESTPVTMSMAAEEGWYARPGSKWPTMPEQMLRYRSAAFFSRTQTPELLMGLQSTDEIYDVINVARAAGGTHKANNEASAAARTPRAPTTKKPPAENVSDATNVKDIAQKKPTAANAPAPEATPIAAEAAAPATPADTGSMADMETGEITDVAFIESTAQPEAISTHERDPNGPPMTESQFDYIKSKMTANELSTDDLQRKFGCELSAMNSSDFTAIAAWIKSVAQ